MYIDSTLRVTSGCHPVQYTGCTKGVSNKCDRLCDYCVLVDRSLRDDRGCTTIVVQPYSTVGTIYPSG